MSQTLSSRFHIPKYKDEYANYLKEYYVGVDGKKYSFSHWMKKRFKQLQKIYIDWRMLHG